VLPIDEEPRALAVPIVLAVVLVVPVLPSSVRPGSFAMMRGVPVLPIVGPLVTAPLQPGLLIAFCETDEPLACPGVELGATPGGVGLLTTPGAEGGATPGGVGLLTTPGTDGLATAPLGCPPVLGLGALLGEPAALPAPPAAPPAAPPDEPPPPLDCALASATVASNVAMTRAERGV
jgi:hypothetical protein